MSETPQQEAIQEIEDQWDIIEEDLPFNAIQEDLVLQSQNEYNFMPETSYNVEEEAYLQKFEMHEEEGIEESEDLEALSDEDAGDYSIAQFSNSRREDASENIDDYQEQFADYDLLGLDLAESNPNLNQEECNIFEPEELERDLEQQDLRLHENIDVLSPYENEKEPEVQPSQTHAQQSPIGLTPQADKTENAYKPLSKTFKQAKRSQTKENQQTKKQLKDKRNLQKIDDTTGTTVSNTKNVDILVVGGGPATLGFLVNSIKNNKFADLVQNDGIAILETGQSLGGGNLCNYGINSNTSANGFVKCIYRKAKKEANVLATQMMPVLFPTSFEKPKFGVRTVGQKSAVQQKKQPKVKNIQVLASAKKLAGEQENVNFVLSPKNRSPLSPKVLYNQDLQDLQNPQSPTAATDPAIHEFKSPDVKLSQTYTQMVEKVKEFSQTASATQSRKTTSKGLKQDVGKIQSLAKMLKPVLPDSLRNEKPLDINKIISATQTVSSKRAPEKSEKQDEQDEDIYEGGKIEGCPPHLCFKEFVNSSIVHTFKQFGRQIVPLSLVGHLLNHVGNNILWYAHQINKTKIFYPMHKALSINLLANGDIITKVQKTDFKIMMVQDKDKFKAVLIEGKQSLIYFRSKSIIIAGGATQGLHPQIYNWFPTLLANPEKLLNSDSFLKKWEFLENVKKLKQMQDEAGFHEKKPVKKINIVIIGGSHSGFSCAWMLLNGPSLFHNNQAGIQNNGKSLYANRKYHKNCTVCCCQEEPNSGAEMQASRDASNGRVSKLQKSKPITTDNEAPSVCKKGACQCVCKCFGFFKYDDWGLQENELQLPQIEEGGIKIIYRDNIKVFFKTSADAVKASYHDFDKDKYRLKDGYVYSFTGLRGDAKNLYLKVKNGLENRIQFVKAQTPEQQRVHVEQADLVIWACGYQSQTVPIYENNKLLKFSQNVPNTQFDVDRKCRILLDDGSVLTKCFACGVGFPVRTKDGLAGIKGEATNPRADSFSLYMNTVGEMLMKNLLPKKRMSLMTQHRVLLQIGQDPSTKVLQTTKKFQKAKAKDLVSILGANVFSQSYLPVQFTKQEQQKVKPMQTQKHVPTKVKQLQELYVLNSTPQFIPPTSFPQNVQVLDPIGNGLTEVKAVYDCIEDQQCMRMESGVGSRSVERRPTKKEAGEFTSEVKRKHSRGMSHTRLGDQLMYSDLVKRNKGSRKKPFADNEENEYQTHDTAYIYLNNIQFLKQRAAAICEERTPKVLDYDTKLQLPDIRGKDSHVKSNQRSSNNREPREIIDDKPKGFKSQERAYSRKRQQFLSGKSPLLFQKKQNAMQRIYTDKQVQHVEKPKSGLHKFAVPIFNDRVDNKVDYKKESPIQSTNEMKKSKHVTKTHSVTLVSERTTQDFVSAVQSPFIQKTELSQVVQEPEVQENKIQDIQEPEPTQETNANVEQQISYQPSKRKASNQEPELIPIKQGKQRKPVLNSSAHHASRSTKLEKKKPAVENRPSGVQRKVNVDIKEVINGNYKITQEDDSIFKVNHSVNHLEKVKETTEFPPINQRISQIPTIKQPKKNMVSSQSTTIAPDTSKNTIGSKNTPSAASTRGLKSQTLKQHKNQKQKIEAVESSKENEEHKTVENSLEQNGGLPKMDGETSLQQINQMLTQSYGPERSRLLNESSISTKKSDYKKQPKPISVSQSQHFKKVPTLVLGSEEKTIKDKRKQSSPEAKKHILLVNESAQFSERKRKDSNKLNKIYAPYDLASREEVSKLMHSPNKRPRSKAPDSSLDYYSRDKTGGRSELKQKVMRDLNQNRNEKYHGVKSASIGIKTAVSIAFTPSKDKTDKVDVVKPDVIKLDIEKKKSSLVSHVIAQMSVNPHIINAK